MQRGLSDESELRAAGIEVFLDQSELRGGEVWDQKIRREIQDCALFIPVISANTASRHEGYFRLEWDLADQRTHMIARSRVFVVPVCLDATTEVAADVPESFKRVQWTRLPEGETPPCFRRACPTPVVPRDVDREAAIRARSVQYRTGNPGASPCIAEVDAAVVLALLTDDGGTGGTLAFTGRGKVTFEHLTDSLTINGHAYTIVGSIATLLAGIQAHSGGSFALANNYDAGVDGTYTQPPIIYTFRGTLEGLGNSISDLTLDTGPGKLGTWNVGLFSIIGPTGTVRDLALTAANVSSTNEIAVGTLAGLNFGTIIGCNVSGAVQVSVPHPPIGGLIGWNMGLIATSTSSVDVTVSGSFIEAGGLVGDNEGTIEDSFATGAVTDGYVYAIGGLVGISSGSIENSFASGAVTITTTGLSYGGGLAGIIPDTVTGGGTVTGSYASGVVTGGPITGTGPDSYIGGLAGATSINEPDDFIDSYWDTTTSGLSQGSGNNPNQPGITGLNSTEFQSGLPTGFSSTVWGENPSINGGLPYLLGMPPQ